MKFPALLITCLLIEISMVASASSNESDNTHHKVNTMHAGAAGHQHDQIEVSSQKFVPTVSLTVIPDDKKGWNLHVKTENFRFAPEHVNTGYVEGEGHAHLYIDGQKITRLYGPWYYLGELSPGEHIVRITLNGNSHSDLVMHGKPIEAIVNIQPKNLQQ